MNNNEMLRIRYEYEQDKNLSLRYAHGVWGGINPQGEIELNFYTESDKLPNFSERLISPDGSYGEEEAPAHDNVKVITRHIHSRLVLNYYTARAVMEWLEDKLEILEAEDPGQDMFRGGAGVAQ